MYCIFEMYILDIYTHLSGKIHSDSNLISLYGLFHATY